MAGGIVMLDGDDRESLGFLSDPQQINFLDEPDTLHQHPAPKPPPRKQPPLPKAKGRLELGGTKKEAKVGSAVKKKKEEENQIVLLDEPDTLHQSEFVPKAGDDDDEYAADRPAGLRLPVYQSEDTMVQDKTLPAKPGGLQLPGPAGDDDDDDDDDHPRLAKIAELALNLEAQAASDAKKAAKQSFKILADGSLKIGKFTIPAEGVGQGKLENISEKSLVELGTLGRGASGRVVKVFHTPSATVLALKCISIGDKHKRDQLVKELSQLQEIGTQCPNIVSFHGAFFVAGETKLALEYMNRGSLQTIVKECGPLREEVLASIARQSLMGLLHLHNHGKVHRDIKPGNILVNHKGEVKVSDLGILADPQNTMNVCQTFVGTLIYMSPERISSEKYSFPADIWSIGMTIITCATGRHPLPTQNGFWDLHSALSEQGPPALPETFSAPIRDFVKLCLTPDPRKRPGAEKLLNHEFCLKSPGLEDSLQYWPSKLKMGAAPEKKIEADVRKTLRGLSRLSLVKAGILPDPSTLTSTTSTTTTRRPPPAPPGEKSSTTVKPSTTSTSQPSQPPTKTATKPPPSSTQSTTTTGPPKPKTSGDLQPSGQPTGHSRIASQPPPDTLSHLQIMGSAERCNKPKSLSHDPATCNCKIVLKIKKPIASTLTSPISPPSTTTSPPPLPSTQTTVPIRKQAQSLGLPPSTAAQDPVSPPPRPPSRGGTRPTSASLSATPSTEPPKDGTGAGRALSPTRPAPPAVPSGSSPPGVSPPPALKSPVFPMAAPLPTASKQGPPPRPPPIPTAYGRGRGGPTGEVVSPVKPAPQPPSFPKSPPPKPKP